MPPPTLKPSFILWGVSDPRPLIPGYVVVQKRESFTVARNLAGEEFFVDARPGEWVLLPVIGSKTREPVRIPRLLALPAPEEIKLTVRKWGRRSWDVIDFQAALWRRDIEKARRYKTFQDDRTGYFWVAEVPTNYAPPLGPGEAWDRLCVEGSGEQLEVAGWSGTFSGQPGFMYFGCGEGCCDDWWASREDFVKDHSGHLFRVATLP